MTRSPSVIALEEAYSNLEVLAGLLDLLDETAAAETPLRTQLVLIGIRKLAEHSRDAALVALS